MSTSREYSSSELPDGLFQKAWDWASLAAILFWLDVGSSVVVTVLIPWTGVLFTLKTVAVAGLCLLAPSLWAAYRAFRICGGRPFVVYAEAHPDQATRNGYVLRRSTRA